MLDYTYNNIKADELTCTAVTAVMAVIGQIINHQKIT